MPNENNVNPSPVPPVGGAPSPARLPDGQARGEGQIEMTREELLDNWKRTAADFENYKKRRQQESAALLEAAKEMAAIRLLPSLQSLEQVLKFAPDDEKYKDWISGLKATILQLEKTMEEMGLKKIKALGEEFNHDLHEAVSEVESEQAGKVIEEVQPGFMLNDKVIIPAKVVVGKLRTMTNDDNNDRAVNSYSQQS